MHCMREGFAHAHKINTARVTSRLHGSIELDPSRRLLSMLILRAARSISAWKGLAR